MAQERLAYKRSRFRTRLPKDFLYTPAHYWIHEIEPKHWRVGFTKFAMRMLGETVEYDFEVAPQAQVALGEVVGWLEGFKATTDVYSVIEGNFLAVNPALEEDPSLLYSRMYDEGWFYEMTGTPDEQVMDVDAYAGLLDQTIDKMQESMS